MSVEALRQVVRGSVATRLDLDYAKVRDGLIWNGRKPTRLPEAIVRPASVEDVQAVVRHAAADGLRVSVRGGGHQFSGIAVQEGIALDLSALNHIRIDPITRTADVGATVRNGELARALTAEGLAFPTGHCASVPLSGYLLGGGFGWNSGAWGPACFSVEAVEVVTADGEIRRASATENPDIFWAARGGGPEFFGVVTAYRLRLQPYPRAITTSVWTYPIERAAEIERWMQETMAVVPRTVEFTALFSSAPPPLAGTVDKVASGIATVFADTEDEARDILSRIGTLAPAGALDIQQNLPTPFDVLYEIIGQFFPEGHRYAVDTVWTGAEADGFLAGLASQTAKAPSPRSFSLGVVLPPGPVELPDAAFSMVGPVFSAVYSIWQDAAEDAANIGWLRAAADALAPWTAGHYVGEADLDRPSRMPASFSPAVWAKLRLLQDRYDPKGMFRSPARIAEALAAAA